jgi:hypothetical protein
MGLTLTEQQPVNWVSSSSQREDSALLEFPSWTHLCLLMTRSLRTRRVEYHHSTSHFALNTLPTNWAREDVIWTLLPRSGRSWFVVFSAVPPHLRFIQ